MNITSIISAIGNNNSIYPLLVRDCLIENPTKVVMTYNQNKTDKNIAKNATRERIIDEYATSAVWLGGIPLCEKICNNFIAKLGFNPDVSQELMKDNAIQNIDLNIKNYANIAQDEVKDLIKIQNNKKLYKTLINAKTLVSIAIPTLVMGFVLPKLNFSLTKKIMKDDDKKTCLNNINFSLNEYKNKFDKSQNSTDKSQNTTIKPKDKISFSSLSQVQKMAITDLGLSAGRVTTARNKNEALDNGIKMSGMMYINYIAPKQIAKLFDFLSLKLFKQNVDLDFSILSDKDFINAIKNNGFADFEKINSNDLINYIVKNPNSIFSKLAQKINLIKMTKKNTPDPRKYIDTDKLAKLKDDILAFYKNINKSCDIDNLIKKAQMIKGINILANITLSSFLLAFCLPKVQFFLRNLIIKNKYEPGLVKNNDKKELL